MAEVQKMQEKSISEQLNDVLGKLSKNQIRFAVAMLECPSKKDAAEAVGLNPDTVYRWNGDVDEAVRLMSLETTASAIALRKKNLIKAMMVKVAGLDSDDEGVRQKSATEIIEAELGKATQYQDVTSGGEPIKMIEVIKHYPADEQ